jgi:uncharacterized protein
MSELPPADEPDTPCVAICSTLFDEVCRGCGRTVMEVANWVFMTADEKRAVWSRPCKIHFKPAPSVDLSFAVG